MTTNKKFKVTTLGCRTNQYESQAYQDQLTALGYAPAKEGEQAEICIINTCTVTDSADSSSRHAIRKFVRENPNAKVVVTGCYVEQEPEKVRRIEGVTHLIRNQDKENLVATLFPDEEIPEFSIKHFEAHTRAFVKVQDGCNSFCTYCTIPYVRGRSRSRALPEILGEVEGLIQNGFKEIVLTGINIGDFDGKPEVGEKPKRLADLVRQVDRMPGLERLRLSSIDPDEVDDDLADAIINGNKTCASMHLVLQSGSNVILKRMNRKYTRQVFLDTVEKMKNLNSDFTVTTDIIVGFPGETEQDFEDTLAVMREVQFAKVHMFPYSERPRTRAALYPNKVPQEVIRTRKQILLRLAEETAHTLRERFLKKRMSVLTESVDEHNPGYISGHSENFLPILIQGEHYRSNELVTVMLDKNTPSGLIGVPCESL